LQKLVFWGSVLDGRLAGLGSEIGSEGTYRLSEPFQQATRLVSSIGLCLLRFQVILPFFNVFPADLTSPLIWLQRDILKGADMCILKFSSILSGA
jgi:hypothetical protein